MSYAYYLIQTESAPVWVTEPPANWVKTEPNIYLHAEKDGGATPTVFSDPDLQAVNPVLIGGWDENGDQIAAVNSTRYQMIRPLGNEPPRPIYDEETGDEIGQTRGGEATNHLQYTQPAGVAPRQLGSNHELYPDDNNPFEVEIRHKEFTGTWSGWGWRAEFIGSAASRDPSVRAIGVYSDPECTVYLYTTGAFVQGPSDWQTDASGNPLTVWYTETPLGQLKQDKGSWHLAVLWASVQEGYQTLKETAESIRHLYWENTRSD